MLKKAIFTVLTILAFGASTSSIAQSDSTDLSLFMTEITLLTATDTLLYSGGDYERLNLEFEVGDTVTFNKIHLHVTELGTGTVIFKKVYALTDLESAGLISDWDVSIPFGNLLNTDAYSAAIIVERYDGTLSATITKTLTP